MTAPNEFNRAANYQQISGMHFDAAHRKGFWRSVLSWITNTQNELLPYDEIRKNLPMSGQHYLGMKEIALDQVVGSVGRYRDFDRAFLPVQTRTRARWMNIDQAHLADVTLPPIEVYKIGEVYFVKDGNHRVSVARQRGQAYLDAEVIEIDSPVDLTPDVDIDQFIHRIEHAEFVKHTELKNLRPELDVELSLPGGYQNLLEHINVHRYFMGIQRAGEVSWQEAVGDWIDQVYLPMVRVIRENNILKEFPGRTEADLYLWIIEHLWYLREEYQGEVSLQDAATHFADSYSKNPLRRILNLIRRTARFIVDEQDQDQPSDEDLQRDLRAGGYHYPEPVAPSED